MGDWIYTRGPSGEYGYINLKTGQFRSSRPLEGTIQRTAENSVGYRQGTQQGRNQAAAKMADSYNSRQKEVHNYQDTTNKLQQKQQSVTIDPNGDAHVVQTDYTPVNEAPMQITGPEKWLVETEAVPFKPLQMGTAYLAGRFGSGAIQNWGRRTVLNDAFSRFGSEIPVSATGKDLLTPYLKAKEATGSDDLYHLITNDKINFNTGMLEGVNGQLWWNPSKPWNAYGSRFENFPVIIDRKTAPIIGSGDRKGIVKDMSKQFTITSDIPLTQVRRPLGFNKMLEYRTSLSEPVSGNTTTIQLLPRQIGTRPILSETPTSKGNTWTLWDSYPLSKPQLSAREQLGLSKGAAGDLNKFQKDALDDFSSYFSSGKYRNRFVFNTKTKKFEYVSEMQPYHINGQQVYINQPGAQLRRDFIRSFGGRSSYFPEYNRASLHLKPTDEQGKPYSEAKWGEMRASVAPETRSTSIVLTSPKVDAFTSISDLTPESKELISQLPNRINKQSMRRFWSNLDEITKPGTYLSGDYDKLPLGVQLQIVSEEPFGLSKAYKSLLDDSYDLVKDQNGSSFERFGLSPDSYYSIVRQGQRPGHSLRFSRSSFGQLNPSAVDNADLYQMWKAAKTPEQKQQFIKTWNDRIYPNSAFIDSDGNIQFLHPFVYYKKLGGRMKLIPKGRGGFAMPTKDQVINFYNQYKNSWGDMDLRQLSGLLGNL